MAAVSCRALCIVRWYEVSRVLSVSSSLATTHKYRNETWCRRWWHISQRNLSLTTKCFAPNLTPILTKGVAAEPKSTSAASTAKSQPSKPTFKASPAAEGAETETAAADVAVTYHRGLPRITVRLPSRNERCIFTLKPITHTVGDLIDMLKKEDRGIDRAVLRTLDGVRISSSNTIETLMENDFRLSINDTEYTVMAPVIQRTTVEELQKLSDIQILVAQLHEALHVREHRADMEREVLAELEDIRLQLEPFEQKLLELETTAVRNANVFVWMCLVLMSVQFGGLARLTWWEYSWDIMEPVTYFVTYGTTMAWFIYFLLTKQEYMLPDVFHRRQLIALHKRAKRAGLDLDSYNVLKEREHELENVLKIIRGPLYEHKKQIEQRKQKVESESSSESSSSSSSPSPSPSRSPSPEKHVPKNASTTKIDLSKGAVASQVFKFS